MTRPDDLGDARGKLADLLRNLRARSAMSGRAAATLAGFGQSKLSKLENGLLLPSHADVENLCSVYGAKTAEREHALDLLAAVHSELEPSRVILRRGADRKQRQIGRIEAETVHQRSFDLGAVIGLLQTPAYMDVVFSRRLTATERAKAVAARIERQRVLTDAGKRFTFVMTEGALRWRAGTGAAMGAQMEHIADRSLLPSVRVGVVPWTRQVAVFPGHEMHIYDDKMVIVGLETAMATFRDAQDVTAHLELFRRLEDVAVFGDGARRLLGAIAADYRHID